MFIYVSLTRLSFPCFSTVQDERCLSQQRGTTVFLFFLCHSIFHAAHFFHTSFMCNTSLHCCTAGPSLPANTQLQYAGSVVTHINISYIVTALFFLAELLVHTSITEVDIDHIKDTHFSM